MHHLTKDGATVVLRRFGGDPEEFARFVPAGDTELPIKLGLVIDTETTGLSVAEDRVIELAIVPFGYTEDGLFWGVGDPFCALQDPGFPIPAAATATNNITDEDVKGKKIDWEAVAELCKEASVVIAHNAKFDRPFVEKELVLAKQTGNPNCCWGCSLYMIDWKSAAMFEGAKPPSKALVALLNWSGYWFPPHRAKMDSLATLFLLLLHGKFAELVDKALAPDYTVNVLNNRNFDANQSMKERGYQFNTTDKFWFKNNIPSKQEAEEEYVWLGQNVYRQSRNNATIVCSEPRHRFLPR